MITREIDKAVTESADSTAMGEVLRDPKLHAVLGAIVVTIGFWLVWGELPVALVTAVALGVAGFLIWQGSTLGR
ncbi:MAG: hypothetical protein ACREVZ_02340, partial [Burkholderiales bacterium]